MNTKRQRRFTGITFLKIVAFLILSGLLFIGFSYFIITFTTANQIKKNVFEVKPHKTALVLGTSKRVAPGRINKFYQYRMDAVKSLYAANKIKYVIVSGDNSTIHYNEAREMKKSLIELGIPEEVIIEDFAGFRTLDSVIRAKLVFGQDSLIIVSQPFHNERALFIANHHNIKAIAFNAEKVAARVAPKTYFREVLARVKCVLDLYILGTMPKYYKDQEPFPN